MIYNIAIDGTGRCRQKYDCPTCGKGIIIYLCRYRSHVSCHGALSSAQRSQ